MVDMVGDSLDEFDDREGTIDAVSPREFPLLGSQRSEDFRGVCADGIDQFQFSGKRACIVGERFFEVIGISTGDFWIVFSQDTFDAVGVDDFEICQMTDHFVGCSTSPARCEF